MSNFDKYNVEKLTQLIIVFIQQQTKQNQFVRTMTFFF